MADLISRQAAIDIERNATVDTNPSHFEAHQKFTQFMDDAEISSFGRWQWSNGFNTALTAVGIDLKKLPSAQPETHEERTETHACDCISRQAAIDAHYEYCNKHPDAGFPVWSLKILENLPSAQPDLSGYSGRLWKAAYERGKAEAQQRWIPCSEWLPEEYGEYRITWVTSLVPSKRFIGDSEYEVTSVWDEERKGFKGEWLLDDYIKNYPDVKVIAWKPLEEPYREEGD